MLANILLKNSFKFIVLYKFEYQTTTKDIHVQVFSPRLLCSKNIYVCRTRSLAINYKFVYSVREETCEVQNQCVYSLDY